MSYKIISFNEYGCKHFNECLMISYLKLCFTFPERFPKNLKTKPIGLSQGLNSFIWPTKMGLLAYLT